jgi:uncharacterized protein YhaN
MRIEEIFIESFGACRRVSIRGLGPGLTAIVGPNEAGKTTILEFLRSIFFGFKRRSGKTNTYESSDGVPRKGWIGIDAGAAGKMRIARNEQTGSREGLLTVTDENGVVLDPMSVPFFQIGLKRSAYESLFAFDLDQLRRLDEDALRGRIMAAALGSTRVNPLEVRNQLEERLKELIRRSTKGPGSLWGLQAQIKEVERKLKPLAQRPQHYSDLKEELEGIKTRAAALAAEIAEKATKRRRLENVLRFQVEWQRLSVLDAEIQLLEDAAAFPADGVARLEQCLERRQEAVLDRHELEQTVENLQEQLTTMNPSETLLENGDAIRSLLTESKKLDARLEDMDRLTVSLEREAVILNDEISGLGGDWNFHRVGEFDLSTALEREIQSFIRLTRESLAGIRSLAPRVVEASERCERLQERIRRNESELQSVRALCEGYLPPDDREKLRLWKRLNEKISELRDSIAERTHVISRKATERGEVSKRIRELQCEPHSLVSAGLFWTLVALVGLAAVGSVAAAYHSDDATAYLFGAVGAALAAAAPVIAQWKRQTDKALRSRITRQIAAERARYEAITEDLAEIENTRRLLRQRIRELAHQARETAEEALGTTDADWEDVVEAEKASSRAEEPFKMSRVLDDSIKSDRSNLASEETRRNEVLRLHRAAEKRLGEVRSSWESFLLNNGLEPGMDPETVLELVYRLRDLKKRLFRFVEEENRLSEMRSEWQAFAERVSAVGTKLDDTDAADLSPSDRIKRWSRMEQEARETLSRRKATLERLKELDVRIQALDRKIEALDSKGRALIAVSGADNEEIFRELGERHERYRVLERDRRAVVQSLVAGLGMADEQSTREYLRSLNWLTMKDDETAARSELEEMRREVEKLARREGMLCREIQDLEAEDHTDRLRAHKEELVARLKEKADEFILTELAIRILDKTLEIYESEKQPKVIERSSLFFKEITANRYKRALFPLDGQGVKVEREDGGRMGEDLLSRGTLEQLYLSLRLAHLDVWRSDYLSMPLVMDDVLVNFDSERAALTAAMLARFSAENGTQVLFFTCHPHVAALFPRDVARMNLQRNSVDGDSQEAKRIGLFAY